MAVNASRRQACRSLVGLAASVVSFELLGQGRPIKVGASLSLTGTLAQSGDKVKRAYELWAKDINARGGLLGRPVEFVILDDRSDAGTSARLYEKLITEDKVELAIGPYGSATTFAATAVTEKYKYPMLCPSAASDAIFNRGFKYIFQLFPPSASMFEPLFTDVGEKAGYRRVAIINSPDLYAKSMAGVFEALAKKHNREIVLKEEFPLDSPDLSSLMLKMRAARPDLVLAGAQLPDAILIVRQLRDTRVLPKALAMTPGATKNDFGQALGKDADGVMLDYLWEPVDRTEQSKTFLAKWKAAYSDEPDAQSAFGWVGGMLLEAAVKSAGSLDSEKLREAFLKLETATLLPGKFKLDPANGKQVGQSLGIAQWQKGMRQIVAPPELATAPIQTALAEWDKRG